MTLLFSLILNSLFIIPALVYAASSPWTQTDWAGGSGQTSWSDSTKFDSSSSVTTSTAGQATLAATSSWYNTSWAYRRKITFDNSAQAENLTNFPVLVKLDSTRVNYSNTQNSGQDIRFTDSDGTTLLSYEIEKWDETGNSFVWVKVPQVDASSSTDYIYVYYGNSSATDGQAATSVWNSNYVGVWHLKEDPSGTSPQMKDSTTNSNDGISAGTMTTSDSIITQIDGGLDMDGVDDVITTEANTGISGNATFTISGWFKFGDSTAEGFIGGGSISTSLGAFGMYHRLRGTTNVVSVEFAGNNPAFVNTAVSTGAWHYIVVTKTPGAINTTTKIYIDGSDQGALDAGSSAGTPNITNSTFKIGTWGDSNFKLTQIDDVRLSNSARSAAWIAASYKSGAGTLNTFASEESVYSTTPGTLTSSIFDTEFTAGAVWGTLTYNATTPSNTSVSVKARTSNSSSMTGATAFTSCTAITSGSDISSNSCVADQHRYIQYQLTLANTDSVSTPTFQDVSIAFATYDATAPTISLTEISSPSSNNTPSLSGTATEGIGTVSNVQYQMDSTSGSWTACTASDGSFNAASEAFSCTPSALTDGSHTMYVRATDSNSNTTANASASTDSFTIDVTSPASFDLDSPGNDSYTSNNRPTFKWKATSDATAGLSKYVLEIDNPSLGSGQASGDFTIDSIPTSRTTDYDTNKYTIKYENFSDSDATNNYISVYTKSHSDWGSSENDGKLREGKVSWKVKARDNAGNERSEGRTLIVDLTGPVITTSGVGSGSPEVFVRDSYHIVTNQKPNITGIITDNYSPDKVEVSIYKENYFLGVETSKEPITSLTYSLSNSSNNKSLSFSIPVPDSLDFGSYQVDIKGADKAGNKSSLSTIYLKIVTSRQAQELLQGKLSDKEKKTIQEHAQVSLPELEKKAILRREKEAAEFDKLTQSFSDQINYVARAFHVIPAFAGMTERIAGKTGEGIHNIATATSSVIASTSEAISKEVEIATSRLTSVLAMTGNSIGSSFLAMTNSVGKTYNNLAQKAPGAVKNTLLTIGQTNQLALNVLNSSQANLGNKISKTSKETADNFQSNIKNIVSSTGNVIASVNEAISNSLNKSQVNIQKQIAQTHQSTSDTIKDKSSRISKGITLAFRSFQKPVNDTAGLLDRTKIWFLTFESIVIDSDPTTISDVTVEELGKDYAIVSWKTNHYAWGKANYGKDLTYGQEVILTKREKVHTARLTGLKPGEKYYFEVMSQNKNYAYDAYYSFETKK